MPFCPDFFALTTSTWNLIRSILVYFQGRVYGASNESKSQWFWRDVFDGMCLWAKFRELESVILTGCAKSWTYQDAIRWLLHVCCIAVTWLLHGCYMAVTWLLHGCYMVVIWLLNGCYMAVTWLLHGCYMAVTWLLHGCYMVVTWLRRHLLEISSATASKLFVVFRLVRRPTVELWSWNG